MSNSAKFTEKARATFETIADVSVETYRAAEERARILAKKTKLRAGIVNEKATIRRLSVELGTAYYNAFKDNPAPEFAQLCQDIGAAHGRIAEKQQQIEDLKAEACADKTTEECVETETVDIDLDETQD